MTDERPLLQISCSFCRRESGEVKKMIAARDGAICDECVGLCLGILAKDSDLFEATIEQARTVAALIDEAGASEPAI